MTKQEALDKVVRLIRTHQSNSGHRMTLYVYKKDIFLLPRCSAPEGSIEIAHLAPTDLREGLRSSTWFVIETIIKFLIKEKKL